VSETAHQSRCITETTVATTGGATIAATPDGLPAKAHVVYKFGRQHGRF
jgi:hypothetical protein